MRPLRRFVASLAASFLALPITASAALYNPLGTNDIRVVIGNVVKAILGLSGLAALIMCVYGGILWVTSMGNPKRIEEGKQTLIWAVIGLVVLFASYAAVNEVISTLAAA